MKQLLKTTLILSILTLSSCGKDDDGPSVTASGQVTINGESGNLTTAYIEDYGVNEDGSFDVDITLTSAAIDLDNEEPVSNFNFVYLDLNTSQQNVLEAGTYTYTDGDREAMLMVDASAGVRLTTNSDEEIVSGTVFEADGGTVQVSVSGNTYTISFNLTGVLLDGTDATATGSYVGTLTESN